MISNFKNKTAVLTGAGSGFGLECARIGAKLGMNIVLVDVQQDALDKATDEITAEAAKFGGQVMSFRLDISKAAEVEAMGQTVFAKLGAPHFVFNNAGVGAGGLIWETTLKDWEWVLGVNVMGVAHGVRVFTPMMLEAAKKDPEYQGHIVNTASMAGLLNAPNMGVYNVSKHAVVALTETLYQDLKLVTDQISASVLCPFFVATGISQSHRNKPGEFASSDAKPTKSQLIGQAMSDKVQIETALLVEGDCQDCAERLQTLLSAKRGIEKVHVKGDPPTLCLHFDANMVSLAAVERMAREMGSELSTRYRHCRFGLASSGSADSASRSTPTS